MNKQQGLLTFFNNDDWVKTLIGFDQFFDSVAKQQSTNSPVSYPPYNVYTKGNSYFIEMATAGFVKSELKVTLENKNLIVSGSKEEKKDDSIKYIHRTLGVRNFKKSFTITDDIKVKSVDYSEGILLIELESQVKKPELVEYKIN